MSGTHGEGRHAFACHGYGFCNNGLIGNEKGGLCRHGFSGGFGSGHGSGMDIYISLPSRFAFLLHADSPEVGTVV
jgi:hypothetical protein